MVIRYGDTPFLKWVLQLLNEKTESIMGELKTVMVSYPPEVLSPSDCFVQLTLITIITLSST